MAHCRGGARVALAVPCHAVPTKEAGDQQRLERRFLRDSLGIWWESMVTFMSWGYNMIKPTVVVYKSYQLLSNICYINDSLLNKIV